MALRAAGALPSSPCLTSNGNHWSCASQAGLVEQLGAQLYPRVTASVAELISNAWDADAANVWITIPFDRKWDESAVIEVLDDGHGMTYAQAQDRYLIVGRNRRREEGAMSEGGRPLHGRKGIGKLAAFGTAGHLELVTVRNGIPTAFGLDYDRLRRLPPTKPYIAEVVADPEPLVNPLSGEPLANGTRVRLGRLRAKRRSNEAEFRRSMARRFALDATKMQVYINKKPLTRFDYDVSVRFPRDARPSNAIELTANSDGWGTERIDATPLVNARRERLRRALAQEAEQAETEAVAEGPKQAEADSPESRDVESAAGTRPDAAETQSEEVKLDIPRPPSTPPRPPSAPTAASSRSTTRPARSSSRSTPARTPACSTGATATTSSPTRSRFGT
jgi:hypothetical protein